MANWTDNLVTIYGENSKELDDLYINLVKEKENSICAVGRFVYEKCNN